MNPDYCMYSCAVVTVACMVVSCGSKLNNYVDKSYIYSWTLSNVLLFWLSISNLLVQYCL